MRHSFGAEQSVSFEDTITRVYVEDTLCSSHTISNISLIEGLGRYLPGLSYFFKKVFETPMVYWRLS